MTRNGPSALAWPATVVVATLWLAIACAMSTPGTGATQSPTNSVVTQTTGTEPTAIASASMLAPLPTATALVGPTEQAPETASAPPTGVLTASSGPRLTGHLGTYCWVGMCSDEFELPAKGNLPKVTAIHGAALDFSLVGGTGFVQWTASYSAGKMADLKVLGSGGSPYDPDSTATIPPEILAATFDTPPTGDWAVVVTLHFAGQSTLVQGGDANYVWNVVVN